MWCSLYSLHFYYGDDLARGSTGEVLLWVVSFNPMTLSVERGRTFSCHGIHSLKLSGGVERNYLMAFLMPGEDIFVT